MTTNNAIPGYRRKISKWDTQNLKILRSSLCSVSMSSQVKSSQIYLNSTFHVQNNSKCFPEIKVLQQGAEKALKICKIIERKKII